jgi:hypothetical protein
MAKTLYFNGETELTRISPLANAEFAKSFPGVNGRKYDGYSMKVGSPIGHASVFVAGKGWNHGPVMPVERIVTYKSNPSKHVCDARCMNASGRTMNCECSCGGKNHGLGGFRAEAA